MTKARNVADLGSNDVIETTSTGVDVTGTVTADGLTVDTDTLHVDTTNNRVGIGTDSPSEKLEIVGTFAQKEGVVKNTVSSTSTGLEFTANAGSANVSRNFVFKSSTSGGGVTERMRIDSSGNVGIGTSNPDSPSGFSKTLEIEDSTNASFVASASGSDLELGVSSSGGWIGTSDTSTNKNVRFVTDGSERARIDSSGNLLVGTTSARGQGIVSKKGVNYRSSNNSTNGVQTYTRTYVSDQNTWRTILTRETNTQGIAEVTVYTSYGTPSSIGSITRVLVLPNKTYTVISQEGSATNGYSSMEFRWVGDDFQVRTVTQYLSYTCLVLLSDSGSNLWLSQS